MMAGSTWPPTPSFASRLLLVRPLQHADLLAMAAWPPFADPLDRAWNWPQELARLGSLDLFFVMRANNPRRREWAITRASDVIGYLGIRDIDRAARSSRLGIGLGAPYVGRGYGTEALSAFVGQYFGALEFRVLRLDVAAHNLRARHLYERLGFRELGQRWQDDGAAEDWAFLSASRYDALREHFDPRGGRMFARTIEMELRME